MRFKAAHLRVAASVAAAIVFVPVVSQWFIELAAEMGFYKRPVERARAVIDALVTSAAFHWIAGGVLGLALGVWLDSIMRRREAENAPGVSGAEAAVRAELAAAFRKNKVTRFVAAVTGAAVADSPRPEPTTPVHHLRLDISAPTAAPVIPHDKYLDARPGEREAKPHVEIRTQMDSGPSVERKDRAPEVRSTITLLNKMSSALPRCTVMVESIECDGMMRRVDLPVLSRPDSPVEYQIPTASGRNLRLVSRVHNVVPAKPFQLHAGKGGGNPESPSFIPLEEMRTYYINAFVDTFEGTVTRAVFKAELGEYDKMKISLLGQASWRLPPSSTGA